MSETSTGRIVTFTLDPENPPQLTAEERHRLESMRDEDIDLSDIPEQTGLAGWFRPGLRPSEMTSAQRDAWRARIAIDEDVLQFFRDAGDASPQRINAALREYVDGQRKTL